MARTVVTKTHILSALFSIFLLLYNPATAQDDATETVEAEEEESRTLNAVVVTVTRREQSAQDIPVSVSAFNAEILDKSAITDVRELTALEPSLFLSSSASEAAGAVARIRGIGTTGDNAGLESSVAIFIDGVFRNRTNVGLTELGSAVERIEVSRGPQGTLAGRNASAGVINIITKRPDFQDVTGYGSFEFGNFDSYRVSAGLSVPIIRDKLAARFDGTYFDRDGFIDDIITGDESRTRGRFLLSTKIDFEPTDNFSFKFGADYSERDENCCASVVLQAGPTVGIIEQLGGFVGSGAGAPSPILDGAVVTEFSSDDPFDRISATTPGVTFQQDVQEWGVNGELNWDFDFAELTYISAYRDYELLRGQDVDFTSADILFRADDGFDQEFETFTQEIRFQGEAGRLDWLLGFFYLEEDLPFTDAILLGSDFEEFANLVTEAGFGAPVPDFNVIGGLLTGAPIAPGEFLPGGAGVIADEFNQETNSWAFFTHNIIDITDRIELTAGLRYSNDSKNLDASFATDNAGCTTLAAGAGVGLVPPALLGLPCLPFFNPFVDGELTAERDDDEVTGTAKIAFDVTSDILMYGSYARGYKDGGFNLDRAGLPNPLLIDSDGDGINDAFEVDFDSQAFLDANGGDMSTLEFEEETVNAYEAGIKADWLEGQLTTNLTYFFQEFDDFQLNTFDGISFIVENVPDVVSQGFEFDMSYRPYYLEGLSLRGGVTFTDARYEEDLGDSPLFAPPTPENPEGGVLFQLPGDTITNAPRWSITWAMDYEHDIPATPFYGFLNLNFRFNSQVFTGSDLDVEEIQGDFALLNGAIGVGSNDQGWRAEFFARNIFDEDFIQVGFEAPLQGGGTVTNPLVPSTQTVNGFLGEPRTYGGRLKYTF
ncbi:MAG: TonB-dependent receptor [Pseudomonadota bacterium]